MGKVYFIITHNAKTEYSTILDLKKQIYDYYEINYVEAIVQGDHEYMIENGYNKFMLLPDHEAPKHTNRWFYLTMYRWWLATYSIFDDEDVFVIDDSDLLIWKVREMRDIFVNELNKTPDKVVCTSSYKRPPCTRYCACYQVFKVKTMRKLFEGKTLDDVANEASQIGSTFTNNYPCWDEVYMGRKYKELDLDNFIDWDGRTDWLSKYLTSVDILNAEQLSTDMLDDIYCIHGYAGPDRIHEYVDKLIELFNRYFQENFINLQLHRPMFKY